MDREPNASRQLTTSSVLLCLLVPVGILLLLAWPLRQWIAKDAGFIFLTARSMADGAHVSLPDSYVSILWTLLQAPAFLIHLFHPIITPKLLGLICISGGFYFLLKTVLILTGGRRLLALLSLVLTACNSELVIWGLSGLDAPLVWFFGVALLYKSIQKLQAQPDSPSLIINMGLISALLVYARTEGLALAIIPIVSIAISQPEPGGRNWGRFREAIMYLGVVVVGIGAYLAIRTFFFGESAGSFFGSWSRFFASPGAMNGKLNAIIDATFGRKPSWGIAWIVLALTGWSIIRRYQWRQLLLVMVSCVCSVLLCLTSSSQPDAAAWSALFYPVYYALTIAAIISVPFAVRHWVALRWVIGLLLAGLAIGGEVQYHWPKLQAFYKLPYPAFEGKPSPVNQRFDAYARRFGLDSSTILIAGDPSVLFHTDLTRVDLSGRIDRTIDSLLRTDRTRLYEHIFTRIRPTFIQMEGEVALQVRLDAAAQFRRDYLPIRQFIDPWVASHTQKLAGSPVYIWSGDFVRSKAVEGKKEWLAQLVEDPGGTRWSQRMGPWPIDSAHSTEFSIAHLQFEKLPGMAVNPAQVRVLAEPLDGDSIKLFSYEGKQYYHPVVISHLIMQFVGAFVQTQDSVFLRRAEKYLIKLRCLAVESDSALFLPYTFDFNVHGDTANALFAPWYSGMAQGEALSTASRLYHLTGKPEYLKFAHRLFLSLKRAHYLNEPWVSQLDTDGYCWIEEYPLENGPDQTLNGFVYALYGLYDYYWVTGSPDAKTLLNSCLTTIKRYAPQFRRPGQKSYYCLGHKHIADAGYHSLHISMFRELYRLSGDSVFIQDADDFSSDTVSTK